MEFEVLVLAPPPLLLPGESREDYQAIFADLAPRSAIDFAGLSWEIQRYRVLRHQLLAVQPDQAIAAAPRRIDLVDIAPGFEDGSKYHTQQNALSWRRDPNAARDIEARLSSYGFDRHVINVEVHAQARELFVLFEGLINAAQTKRILLLREIRNQRYVGGPRRPRFAKAEI